MITKQIPNYPFYLVRENGDVFSTKRGKTKKLSFCKDKDGYLKVSLSDKGKATTEKAHRLVLMAFDRAPKEGEIARHFPDDNKLNNHISNLQWGTPKETAHDRDKVHKTGYYLRNEDHYKCKLTNKQILAIRELYKKGDVSQYHLADKYSVSQQHIGDIVNNKTRNLNQT